MGLEKIVLFASILVTVSTALASTTFDWNLLPKSPNKVELLNEKVAYFRFITSKYKDRVHLKRTGNHFSDTGDLQSATIIVALDYDQETFSLLRFYPTRANLMSVVGNGPCKDIKRLIRDYNLAVSDMKEVLTGIRGVVAVSITPIIYHTYSITPGQCGVGKTANMPSIDVIAAPTSYKTIKALLSENIFEFSVSVYIE